MQLKAKGNLSFLTILVNYSYVDGTAIKQDYLLGEGISLPMNE